MHDRSTSGFNLPSITAKKNLQFSRNLNKLKFNKYKTDHILKNKYNFDIEN